MMSIAELVDRASPAAAQATQAGELFVRTASEERPWVLLGLEYAIHLARYPALREHLGRRYRNVRDAMAEVISTRAAAAGVTLPVPADQLAIAYFAMGNGFLLEKLIDPEAVPDELFGWMLATMLAGMVEPLPHQEG